MKLSSNSIVDGQPIPGDFAFCVPAREGHVSLGANRNPHLAWSDLPPLPGHWSSSVTIRTCPAAQTM